MVIKEEGYHTERRWISTSSSNTCYLGPRDATIVKMKHTKKMRLVELEPVGSCVSNELNNNISDEIYSKPRTLQNMDNEMKHILNDAAVEPDQKWHLYHQALQRYLTFIKRHREADRILKESPVDDGDDTTNAHEITTNNTFSNRRASLISQQQQPPLLQASIPILRRAQKRKSTVPIRRMVTRRTAKPGDIVSPLHKSMIRVRKAAYKSKGHKDSMPDINRNEVSNRRKNVADAHRNLNENASDSDSNDDEGDANTNMNMRPCRVVLKNWVASNIKK